MDVTIETKIKSRLMIFKDRLTDSDIGNVYDHLIQKNIVTLEDKKDLSGKSISMKVDTLLEYVFKADAGEDFLETLDILKFQALVHEVENSAGFVARSNPSLQESPRGVTNKKTGENTHIAEAASDIAARFKNIEEEATKTKTRISEMESKHEIQLQEVQSEMKRQAKDTQEQIEELQASRHSLKKTLDLKTKQINTLTTSVHTLKQEKAAMEEKIKNVLDRNTDLTAKMSTVVKQYESDIKRLTEDKNKAEQTVIQLKEERKVMENIILENQEELERFRRAPKDTYFKQYQAKSKTNNKQYRIGKPAKRGK